VEAPRPRPTPPAPRAPGAWRTLAASFSVAWGGVVETALSERNMRIHLVAALLVALVASGIALGIAEQLALLLCVFLVLAAEVANSALEALVDLVTRERHDRARVAKDAGAGAVLVLATGSAAVLVAVLLHAWPEVTAARAAVWRQAALGLPLAALTGALLAPWRRPRAVDLALAVGGGALLAALAPRTTSALFTALTALLLAVAIAVAGRRRLAG
jgi:diacylglycerol kinase (ATP)